MPRRASPPLRALGQLVAHLFQRGDESSGIPFPSAEALPGELVQRHRLESLAYKAGFERFREGYARNAFLADRRRAVLDEAVRALRDEGVRVVLLKGSSYLGVIYSDPADRPMGDIDLLVPDAQFSKALSTLRQLRYQPARKKVQLAPTHHARTLRRSDGAALDLHRGIMQPQRARIDMEAVWSRAVPATDRRDGSERLSPLDEACFHLLHIARHELMTPVISYIEADRLLQKPGVSWDAVLARSRSFRAERPVTAVRAAGDALRRLADAEWPTWIMALLPGPLEILRAQPPPRVIQIARKLILAEGPPEALGLLGVAAFERLRPSSDRW